MFEQETHWIEEWGGVCQSSVPGRVPMGMFSDALNMEIDSNGNLCARLGHDLFAPTICPDGRPVRVQYEADFDGVLRLILATDHNVYEYLKATETWKHVYEIVNASAKRMLFDMLNSSSNPTLIFGNGADNLKKWDGTYDGGTGLANVQDCGGGAPNGRPVCYRNYVVVFDIPGAPGKVQFCFYNGDPDTWEEVGTQKYLEMLGKVTSVFPHASGLIIFSKNRSELFPGDPDAIMPMQNLSTSIGNVVHESIADCNGILVWLSQSGYMMWSGGGAFPTKTLSNPEPVSRGVVESNIQRDVDRLYWSDIESVSGVFDPTTNRYYSSAKIQAMAGGTRLWRLFHYDFKRAAWFPWEVTAHSLGVYTDPTTGRKKLLVGDGAGALLAYGNSQLLDYSLSGATEYDYWARLGDIDLGAKNHFTVYRALTIGTTGQIGEIIAGKRTVKIDVRGEFDRIRKTTSSIETNAGGFILGFNVLGDKLTEAYRYQEKREPIAVKTKHLGLRIFGHGRTNAVGISALGISYSLQLKRPTMVG